MASVNPKNPGNDVQSDQILCGYVIHDMSKTEKRNLCIFCGYVIKEPIQFLECGDRCCKGCYESRAATSPDGKMTCPVVDCGCVFDRSRIMIDRAFKRELDSLKVSCSYKESANCNWHGELRSYQEHLDQNHFRHVCSHCDESFTTSQALSEHVEKMCPVIFQACPLGPGCGHELIRKDQFREHLLSVQHQETVAAALVGKYSIPDKTDPDQIMETSTIIEELEQQTSEKLTELADKVQKLNDDTVSLSREFVKLSELCTATSQEIVNLQRANNERNMIMNSLQPKQNAIQEEIEKLKQVVEENQYVPTDASLTWRIDRVAEKMADAQSERVPSIYSPVFYSSPTGYKMRARLYLHGDGNAKRTHMSLFFLLMKGDYDAMLTWPFNHKVTFCLFDQTGNNRHIIDSFRPDVKSSSFQRPKTDANVASGIPKFFPLPMIQQDDNPYVRDDTLFLKIVVDLSDTPKAILPFILTLNPGLPNHVQQSLIVQEKNKRQQQTTSATVTTTQMMSSNSCG